MASEHTLPATLAGSSGIDSASRPAATEASRGRNQSAKHTYSTGTEAGTMNNSMASRDSWPKFATAHYKLTNLVDSLIQYLYYLVEQEEDTLSWMHAHELEQRGCLKGWLSTGTNTRFAVKVVFPQKEGIIYDILMAARKSPDLNVCDENLGSSDCIAMAQVEGNKKRHSIPKVAREGETFFLTDRPQRVASYRGGSQAQGSDKSFYALFDLIKVTPVYMAFSFEHIPARKEEPRANADDE